MMKITPTTQPISWFRDRKTDNSLVLKPPYQRKPVWTLSQKSYLVDTILGGYNMPEIYIHRETSNDGSAKYNIVDGQQRIRTILEFMDGDFILNKECDPSYFGKTFEDLSPEQKRGYWGFTVFAREITDASEDEIRNLFKRMNKNVVSLNPQELRHSTFDGEFIHLMEELSEDTFWAENKIVTANEIRRMNDVQYVSELFVSMINGIQDKTKELDSYYELYDENFLDKYKWRDRFFEIKQIIIKIFPELRETRWKNKSDFYTLFMVVNQHINEGHKIPDSSYSKINKELTNFASKVSDASQKNVSKKGIPKEAIVYSNSILKSTTDKDRRLARHNVVYKIINKFIKK